LTMDLEAARALWHPKTIYLNTATYGLPPEPSWDALQDALEDWRGGRTSFYRWDESVTGARRAFGRIVGVPEEWVCVSSTVASLVGLVAASVPDGTSVLAPEAEFTSALWPWMVHADRRVSVRTVPLDELVSAIDSTVDVVSFSVVQSATGEVADVEGIVEAARAVGAATLADVTQACGWLPLDAGRFDFAVCGGYKWLMSPRGTAFMTVGPNRLEHLRPLSANWYAGKEVHDSYYGAPLRLAKSARRLDVSPAWFSWVGTLPALELIAELGVEAIHDHDVALANRFLEDLDRPRRNSAIVTVDLPGASEKLERAGIMASVRAGSLRASFHVYNTNEDVDAALDALA
jgi:selenocysteine lyase/cysteine desulfurase